MTQRALPSVNQTGWLSWAACWRHGNQASQLPPVVAASLPLPSAGQGPPGMVHDVIARYRARLAIYAFVWLFNMANLYMIVHLLVTHTDTHTHLVVDRKLLKERHHCLIQEWKLPLPVVISNAPGTKGNEYLISYVYQ